MLVAAWLVALAALVAADLAGDGEGPRPGAWPPPVVGCLLALAAYELAVRLYAHLPRLRAHPGLLADGALVGASGAVYGALAAGAAAPGLKLALLVLQLLRLPRAARILLRCEPAALVRRAVSSDKVAPPRGYMCVARARACRKFIAPSLPFQGDQAADANATRAPACTYVACACACARGVRFGVPWCAGRAPSRRGQCPADADQTAVALKYRRACLMAVEWRRWRRRRRRQARYTADGFDLDLTYVTPTCVAMSLPAEGAEASYRNPLFEVQVHGARPWKWVFVLYTYIYIYNII